MLLPFNYLEIVADVFVFVMKKHDMELLIKRSHV
jgi:hypothetical protein